MAIPIQHGYKKIVKIHVANYYKSCYHQQLIISSIILTQRRTLTIERIKLVQYGVTITAEPRPTLYLEHYNCDHRHCFRFRIDSQSLYL